MNRKATIGAPLRGLLYVALLLACLLYVAPKWEQLQVANSVTSVAPWWIAAASMPALLHYAVVFYLWLVTLRLLGIRAGAAGLLRSYVLSLLPRYLPGKLVGPGVRASLALRAQIPAPAVTGSLFLETGLALTSAAVLAALGLLVGAASSLQEFTRWLVLAFVIGVAALGIAAVTPWFGPRLARWTGVSELLRSPFASGALLCGYILSWWLPTLSHWALARAVHPLPITELLPLMVALAVSWGVGVLSVVAPAGLVVREGILYLFVRRWMPEPDAILFVTLSRALSVAIEGLLTACWFAYSLLIRRRSAPSAQQ